MGEEFWLCLLFCDPAGMNLAEQDENGKASNCKGDETTGDSDGDGICDSDDPCPQELIWEGNYQIIDTESLNQLKHYTEITGSLILDPQFLT